MQIHEIIEDDLSIHYIIQLDPEDMRAMQILAKHGAQVLEDLETKETKAAFIGHLLAHYPITTYQQKLDAIPLQKKH